MHSTVLKSIVDFYIIIEIGYAEEQQQIKRYMEGAYECSILCIEIFCTCHVCGVCI